MTKRADSHTHTPNRAAFTLIELLVVIAIIGLLSTIAVVSLGSARIKSRDVKRKADVLQVQQALSFYYDKYGDLPTGCCSDQACWAPGGAFATALSEFMPTLPQDPSYSKNTAVSCGNWHVYCFVRKTSSSNCFSMWLEDPAAAGSCGGSCTGPVWENYTQTIYQ